MQLSNIPGKLVLPFANAGGKSTIPVASQIGITAGAASLTDGFPPLTRTPIAAGGVPPSGLDMNGILYEMSAIIRWANAGGGYPYDGTFATDTNVGGYPKGARIMRSDGTGYWFNTVENNVTDPEAAGAAAAGWVPDYQSGVASITMSGSSVTLTPNQYGKPLIVITGTLSANLNLIFPPISEQWQIVNSTTGNYTITAKTPAGIGIALSTGFRGQIFGDGVNIYSKDIDTYLTPEQFGAIGDDSTDDYVALQAAFNTGKPVRLTNKYFTGTTLVMPENVIIFGDGKRSQVRANGNLAVLTMVGTSGTRKTGLILRDFTVRRTGGVTGSPTHHPIEITFSDNCRIDNVTVDGASSTYPGNLICRGTRNLKVSNCDFINGASLFISSSDDTTSGAWNENTVVSNCRVIGSGTVGQGFNAIYSKNLMFDNCVASGIGSTYGCGFLLEYEITGAVLNNCISYENVRSGFYLEGNIAYGVKDVSLNNCIAYGNGEAGITSDANFINIAVNGGAYFSNTGTFVGGSGHGMLFSANGGVSINGALIHSNAASGISYTANPYKLTIVGCQIRDNIGNGIYFTGTPVLVDIIGNIINGNYSSVSGWSGTAGTWDDGPWTTYVPTFYKVDGTTIFTPTSQSVKYKRIGSVVHIVGEFKVTSGTLDWTTYFTLPFSVAWTGSLTGDDALSARGMSYGDVSLAGPLDSRYFNARLAIANKSATDTIVQFHATYEI